MKYFGTDGIRSTFEKSFLNENFSFALGEALGAFMKEQNIPPKWIESWKTTAGMFNQAKINWEFINVTDSRTS